MQAGNGQLYYDDQGGLTKQQTDAGLVLLCSTYPESDVTIVTNQVTRQNLLLPCVHHARAHTRTRTNTQLCVCAH